MPVVRYVVHLCGRRRVLQGVARKPTAVADVERPETVCMHRARQLQSTRLRQHPRSVSGAWHQPSAWCQCSVHGGGGGRGAGRENHDSTADNIALPFQHDANPLQ